ncbi:MAG: hypothetical protein IT370_34455 [Deltaproteobacteria bacterium]|nr:hypothetical protein [Deltaproteobacteria bacterium]
MAREPRKPVRGRRALPDKERKGRLIQTRVAEPLDEALHEEARKKRVTVSQLIRNVLEDTFNLVDNIVTHSTQLGRTVTRDAQRLAASAQGIDRGPAAPPVPATPASPPFPAPPAAPALTPASSAALALIDAWQEVVLNRDATCARCGTALRKGEKGLLGVGGDATAPRLWLCAPCSKAL